MLLTLRVQSDDMQQEAIDIGMTIATSQYLYLKLKIYSPRSYGEIHD